MYAIVILRKAAGRSGDHKKSDEKIPHGLSMVVERGIGCGF
jgi:hypothetical protein